MDKEKTRAAAIEAYRKLILQAISKTDAGTSNRIFYQGQLKAVDVINGILKGVENARRSN